MSYPLFKPAVCFPLPAQALLSPILCCPVKVARRLLWILSRLRSWIIFLKPFVPRLLWSFLFDPWYLPLCSGFCCCSVLSDSLQPHGLWATRLPVLHYLPEFAQTHMSIESVMSSNHLALYHPFLLLPSIFSSLRVFEWAVCIRWSEYWNFSISPSNEHKRLISFRIDWFDLLTVQGTLKSLL